MEILVVGVGDAFSARQWGTNFLVRDGGVIMAVDCPDSYFRALAEAGFGVTVDDLDALFLTHLHGDHVNGLEMTLARRKFVTQKRLPIYTTPEVAAVLWEGRLKVALGTMFDGTHYNSTSLEDFAELHVVPWGEPTKLVGNLTVETRRTVHHIPAAALQITASHGVFGHSGDTAWDPELLSWLSQADQFFHEANFGPAHTPIAKLAALDAELRQRMHVVHYADAVDPNDFPGLRFAQQGQTLVIGASSDRTSKPADR